RWILGRIAVGVPRNRAWAAVASSQQRDGVDREQGNDTEAHLEREALHTDSFTVRGGRRRIQHAACHPEARVLRAALRRRRNAVTHEAQCDCARSPAPVDTWG